MSDPIPVRQVTTPRNDDRIYVRGATGFYQKLRTGTLWALMGLYFGVCWIAINGQQLVLFDIPARRFHLFGATFWPQDFFLLALLLIICAFGLFFITTLLGRIWCGYTCPQTAWTFIFMWLEEKIEGSRNQRIKLDRSGSLGERSRKKGLKHFAWLAIAFWTGLTFVAYFYPARELVPDMFTSASIGFWAWFWIGFFTLATYLNAGWMREKVCLHMCPYARFQSVMFDRNTRTVSYDFNRGEPRGPRKKSTSREETGLGDCVDCGICVQVCPTGIDIRDGLQYECINCGLCVDACNEVMDRMDYDRGLIRYATEQELEGHTSRWLRPRTIGYGAALLIMVTAFSVALSSRPDVQLEVMRDRGGLYQLGRGDLIENSYSVKVTNRTDSHQTFTLSVAGPEGIELLDDVVFNMESGREATRPAVVQIPGGKLKETNTSINFEVQARDNPSIGTRTASTFIGPVN